MSIQSRKLQRVRPRSTASSAVTVRVAAGQTSTVVDGNRLWLADKLFSGGSVATTTSTISTARVASPAPHSIYQAERWGEFSYTLANLSPLQTYTFRLHFTEMYYTSAGQRMTSITANGQPVVTNYDPFTAAGGQFIADVRTFTASANASGSIALAFTASPNNDAKICAIEITGTFPTLNQLSSITATPGSTNINLSWSEPIYITAALDGYAIYRDGVKVTTVSGTTLNYNLQGLANQQTYTVAVKPIAGGVEQTGASTTATTRTQTNVPLYQETSFTGLTGQTIRFAITLPVDYNTSGKSYPVLFSLHGRDQTYATFHGEALNVHQRAINAGILEPVVIVTPDSFISGRWEDTSAGPAETNFMELIPYIESHYNVKSGPNYRLLTGFSMGGHGAFRFGVKYPKMFAAVWSVDGAMSYTMSDYTQYTNGKTSSYFHITTCGGNLNGSRVQSVINAVAAGGVSIPYVWYPTDHEFRYFADNDQAANYPAQRFLQSRLGIAP